MISEELEDLILKGKLSSQLHLILTDNFYNNKNLQRLDENSQVVLNNIYEEFEERIIPVVERTLLYLSELRGIVKAKQI